MAGINSDSPERELHQQLSLLRQSMADKSGCLTDLDKSKKRWLVTGVVLNSVLTPTLRKYVSKSLEQLYDTLKQNKNIDTQQYPHHLTSYLTTFLNYEAINGNKTLGIRQQNRFNYKVKDAVDLSKLFLKTHMAHYNAFDDSFDSFALLEVIIGSCPAASQACAKKVKDEVRNPWAHCDFRDWGDKKYQTCIKLIKELIESLGLHNQEEVIAQLLKWNQNGEKFIDGTSPELVALGEIQKQVQAVQVCIERIASDTPNQIPKLKEELTVARQTLSKLVERVEDLGKVNEHMTACIGSLQKKIGEQEEIVPQNMKEIFQIHIDEWKKDEETFSVTRATDYVAGLIKETNVVVVVGSSGSGKSSLIHHVALKLKTEFDIIPFVLSPADIIYYRDMKKNQLVVIDDLCGKNYINETELQAWEKHMETIQKLFPQEPICEKGNLKILVSCRLQIFRDEKFKDLKIFTQSTVNLQSKEHCLLPEEKLKMIKKYTDRDISEDEWREISKGLDECHYFPLLCRMSIGKPVEQLIELFRSPITSITKDIQNMITYNTIENCTLVLSVLFPEGFHKSLLNPIPNSDTYMEKLKYVLTLFGITMGSKMKRDNMEKQVQQKVTKIVSNFNINLDIERDRRRLSDAFERLVGTYFKKAGLMYSISHDKLYDMVAVVSCHNATELYLQYAPSTLIAEQFMFKSLAPELEYQLEEMYIYLNEEEETKYFDRIFQDLEQNSFKPVFRNIQLEHESYQCKLMTYIELHKVSCDHIFRRLDKEGMNEVIKNNNNYKNTYTYTTTPIIEATKAGFYKLVEYLIIIKCDLNKKDSEFNSPLYYSCKNGFVNILHHLIRNGGNAIDALNYACQFGLINVVKMLVDGGVDLTQCVSVSGWTPLTAACLFGHKEIMEMLLERGADLKQCDNSFYRWTPLIAACYNGHKDIVEKLIERGVDISQCDRGSGWTPLTAACYGGNKEIVKILIDRGADLSQCNIKPGWTPMIAACKGVHIAIVELLIKKGADVAYKDREGKTALDYTGNDIIINLLKHHINR